MKKTILAIALLFISTTAQAYPVRASGLFNICGNPNLTKHCLFYSFGVIDGAHYQSVLLKVEPPFCKIRSNMTVFMNIPKVIVEYAKKHPKILLGPGEELVLTALKDFTCRDWAIEKPKPKLKLDDF